MTTSSPIDEIALPRFEDRLWAELADEHEEHRARFAGPGGPGRSRHRRRVRRSLAVGVAAVAAAAAVFATVVVQRPDAPPGGGDGTDLATRIVSAMEEAAATSVVHVAQDNTSYGDDETWTDETTGAFRSLQHDDAGGPLFDSGAAAVPGEPDPDVPVRTVDYCFDEYTEGAAALPVGPGSATRWVQNYLERGWLVEDGTEVVDGRELIRLREVPDEEYGTPGQEPGYVLVDPETYRPVLNVGYPGSDDEYTQRFEYLPRSPENLARLVAPVPDGFARVDSLRGDGERSDAGCT
jgi:hypothetical protein